MKDLWLKSKEKAVSDEQTAVSSNDPANSAAEQYRFTPEQDRQPAKLLKLENQSLWSAALYGIGNNSGDLVTLALSQVGNARGLFFLASQYPPRTKPIGVWGQKHLRYLKEYRRAVYITLPTSGRLNAYLANIDGQSQESMERLTEQMK